jgi:hypothetical protein
LVKQSPQALVPQLALGLERQLASLRWQQLQKPLLLLHSLQRPPPALPGPPRLLGPSPLQAVGRSLPVEQAWPEA